MVAALTLPVPLQAGAIGGLAKLIRAERVAQEASVAAKAVRTVRNLSPELRALEEGVEATRYASALESVEIDIAIGRIKMQPGTFRGLIRNTQAQRSKWSEGIPLSDDMPNIIVKAPNIAGAPEAMRQFALARLDEPLKAPFSVSNLKIVPLGMADDATRSAEEIAAFERTIPIAQLDRVGPLPRLDGARLTRSEMVERLRPYDGKTVVVVGHIEEEHGTFIVHLKNGETRPIPISDWLAAANEANVNLVPIGCNSEKIGAIGAKGLINSRQVRQSLKQLIDREPKNLGEFLQALTSKDLQVVIDPVTARLFESGIVLRETNTAAEVARVGLGGFRYLSSAESSYRSNISRLEIRQSVDPCFSRATGDAFDSCLSGIRKVENATLLAKLKICRDQNTLVLPKLTKEADHDAMKSKTRLTIFGLFYGIVSLCFAWLALISNEARRDQEDFGNRFANLFGRWRLREVAARLTGRGSTLGLEKPISDIIQFAALIAIAAGIYAFESLGLFAWFYALVALGVIGYMLEAGKQAAQRSSLLDVVKFSTSGLLLAGALLFLSAAGDYQNAIVVRDGLIEEFRNAQRPPTIHDVCWPVSANLGAPAVVSEPISGTSRA